MNLSMGIWYAIGVDTAIHVAREVQEYGGPGGWSDLEMLVVGLKGKGQIAGNGMSSAEYQTHMSLWVVASSLLVIGGEIHSLEPDTASLLMNREVLDMNQDTLGIPARCVRQIGMFDAPKLTRDLWAGQDIADFKTELPFIVKPHEMLLLKISQ